MRDYQLMTAIAFMQSYDRDVLDLQDNPEVYIREFEAQLEHTHPLSPSFDKEGNKVWPVGVMRQAAGIQQEEPQWGSTSAAT